MQYFNLCGVTPGFVGVRLDRPVAGGQGFIETPLLPEQTAQVRIGDRMGKAAGDGFSVQRLRSFQLPRFVGLDD